MGLKFNYLAGILAGGGAVMPPGGMKSMTINDATAIDPVVTTAGPNIGSAVGASGSGWVATIVLKGITSLIGTCDPTKLTVNVSDPGFDTSGNVTTVLRTLTGVCQVRRQYPNGNSQMISTDGSDLTLLISLDDALYSGTTIVSATLVAGFYTGSVAGNSGTAILNRSVTAYTKPLFAWMNVQSAYAGAGVTTCPVEGVAFHRHARAGQQVAAIQYSVTDGTATTTPAIVGTPTLSTQQTQGNIPEVWAATLDLSTLATAQIVNANAKVYPWLGDATAVLNLAVDGVVWPTSLPQTMLRIFNDRTGTYGGAVAYVKVGASGGTVSKTAATALAAPYPTISAAMNAVYNFNAANGISHSDHGGAEIRLMDASGSAVTHTNDTGPAIPAAPSATYCTMTNDPASVGSIKVDYAAQIQFPDMMRYAGKVVHASNASQSFWFLGQNNVRSQIAMDGITLDGTAGGARCVAYYDTKYLRNVTFTGGRALLINGLPNTTANIATMIGCVSANFASTLSNNADNPHVRIGNNMPDHVVWPDGSGTPGSGDGDHGGIVYNNRFLAMIYQVTAPAVINSGFANVQNLYEALDGSNDSGVIAMNFLADGNTSSILNYVEMHNTAVGNRCSRLYNDVVADKVSPNGLIKIGRSLYNIWDNYNNKTDTFNGDGAGSVGNWQYNYSVGNYGNVSLFGDVQRASTTAPHNDNVTAPYLGAAWLPSSEYNLLRTSGPAPIPNLTQAQIMALFGNYTVAPKGSPAVGGNYVPTNAARTYFARVPVGRSVLKRDLAGTLRRTDGTGCVGAYESL